MSMANYSDLVVWADELDAALLGPDNNDTEALMAGANNSSATPTRSGVNVDVIAYCYILPAVCILGIVGNIANLSTLASNRLRAVSYMYLRALAIADLCCMCSVMIFVSTQIAAANDIPTNQYWLAFYKAHCMLPLINFSISAGVLTIVVLTVERYISVCFPIYFRSWNSPKRATLMIIAAYLVPTVLYIPYAIWRHQVRLINPNDTSEGWKPDDGKVYKELGWQIYKWSREGLLRFAPILALTVLNLQIIVAFKKRTRLRQRLNKRPASQSTSASSSQSQRDDAILFLLAAIVVLFFICNIPAAINLLFINEDIKKNPTYQIFRATANLLEITNHAINFYVFCLCSSDYRSTFLEKFPCVKHFYVQIRRARSFVRVHILRREPTHPLQVDDSSSEMTAIRTINREAPVVTLANNDTVIVVQKEQTLATAAEQEALLPPPEEPGCYKGPVNISDENGDIRWITDDDDDPYDITLL